MNVDSPLTKSSLAPILVNILSNIDIYTEDGQKIGTIKLGDMSLRIITNSKVDIEEKKEAENEANPFAAFTNIQKDIEKTNQELSKSFCHVSYSFP